MFRVGGQGGGDGRRQVGGLGWAFHPFLVRVASICPAIPLQETKKKMFQGLLHAETMAGLPLSAQVFSLHFP